MKTSRPKLNHEVHPIFSEDLSFFIAPLAVLSLLTVALYFLPLDFLFAGALLTFLAVSIYAIWND